MKDRSQTTDFTELFLEMIYNLTLKFTPPQPLPGLTPSPSPKGEGSLGRGVPTGSNLSGF